MGKGIFGGMFDLNGDGDLDVFEQTLEFQALSMIMDYSKKKKESEQLSVVDMDDDEREEFLEAAGFDLSDSEF